MNMLWNSFVSWGLCLCSFATYTSDVSAGILNVEGFKAANVEGQREILRDCIQGWLSGVSNCQFTSTTQSGERVMNGNKIQQSDDWNIKLEFVTKRLDNSYWLSARIFSNDFPSGPIIESESNFDQENGESRAIMLTNGGRKLLQGRRDSEMDDTVFLNSAARYLGNKPNQEGIRLYSELMSSIGVWKFQLVEETGEFLIQYPYRHPKLKSHEVDGECAISFSYIEEIVPVRYTESYCLTFSDKKPTQKLVADFKNVTKIDGFPIPLQIEEIETLSKMGSGRCIFKRTDIIDINLGSLSMADLALDFPEGTKVVDVIDAVSYTAGQGSAKSKSRPLLNKTSLNNTGDLYRGGWSPFAVFFVSINCFLVCVFAMKLFYSARAKERKRMSAGGNGSGPLNVSPLHQSSNGEG